MSEDDATGPTPASPPALAPPLARERLKHLTAFVRDTWTGRILLLNTVAFVALCVYSGSLLLPDTASLLLFGAKDPVGLAQGEWWRLVAPMFLHIGVLHFAVNNYMLYVVGKQLEPVLGGTWFALIYLMAGIAGNIASAVFTVNLSAGASGAIFGLLGAGFFLERALERRVRLATGRATKNRAYAMTIGINLLFGAVVPFVDNSAHLGGLLAGLLLTLALAYLQPNHARPARHGLGAGVVVAVLFALSVGVYFSMSAPYMTQRLIKAARESDELEDKALHYSQAIAISPDEPRTHLERARLFLLAGETKLGIYDLRQVLEHDSLAAEVAELADDLQRQGRAAESWQVRRMLEHRAAESPLR